jgi:DNA-binding CsgD family transcriptional regulator
MDWQDDAARIGSVGCRIRVRLYVGRHSLHLGRNLRRAMEMDMSTAQIHAPSVGQPGYLRGALKNELTPRELEVLVMIADGAGDREIAKRLGISPETVKAHGYHIRDKTGTDNRTAMAMYAVRKGLVTP